MRSGSIRYSLILAIGVSLFPTADAWSGAGESQYSDRIQALLALTPSSITSSQALQNHFNDIEMIVRETARIGDLDTALSLAEKGTSLAPDQLRSTFLLGWIRGSMGRLEPAVDTLRKALTSKTDRLPDPEGACKNEALTHLGGFLIQLGKNHEAVPYLEEACAAKQSNPLPLYLLGEACHNLNETDKAESAFKSAFAKDPDLATPVDYLFFAWALDKKGKAREVHDLLNQGIEAFPVAPALHLNRGINQEILSHTREAFFDYQLEILIEAQGPYADAARKRIERIERVQVTAGETDSLLKAVMEYLAHRKENRKSEAEANLAVMTQLDGLKSPYVIYICSEAMIERGQAPRAIEVLSAALKEHPADFLLKANLAEAYAKTDQKDQADILIRELLIQAPDHWKLQQLLGPE